MIHNTIAHMRKAKKMTQQQLADKIDISRQTVISMEKGNYTPSLMLAMKLAKFFKAPVEELFFIDGEQDE